MFACLPADGAGGFEVCSTAFTLCLNGGRYDAGVRYVVIQESGIPPLQGKHAYHLILMGARMPV
eukprot:1153699-Pelagomonas_calceolata.AAC.10